MAERTENFEKWLHELRTTSFGQARNHLFGHLGNPSESDQVFDSACCLGIACMIALDDSKIERLQAAGVALAPIEVGEWIGALHPADIGRYSEIDFYIDWPEDLADREGDSYDEPAASSQCHSAASLNDNLCLTFAQIADVFDYFGIKDAH